ncbi:MAG: UvrD-helicase domain-containing protein, partial [Pseudomonadales bacterium]|nr:UvrD-helicase domain-containing protein [Pseudomonadales bacterium]
MLKKLNPQQREAVKDIQGPMLVLAGAGSGKTSVITHKIAYLVKNRGVEARHIAAVTFTNKAAREMKERVAKLLGKKEAEGLTVSTFHTLGLNIIRRELKTLNYKNGFSIFDAADSQNLLKELLLQNETDDKLVDQIQQCISNWKNELISPQHAIEQAQSDGEMRFALVYQRYTESLQAYNAVDFDDLISLPVQLFTEQPDILHKWQARMRYLLVDEYQDT